MIELEPQGLRYLRCPACGGALRAERRKTGVSTEDAPNAASLGEVLACEACTRQYPVVAGLARFVTPDNYAASFGFQWNQHASTQLDSHTGLPISATRVRTATNWPERLVGEVILEAGSGAGRFTEVLVKSGATVLSFDYSSAVDANASNNGRASNLLLFQADIFAIPCPPKSMDRVFCLGVIQHTPDPVRAFRSLASRVKPGGQLVIDVYARTWVSMLHWRFLLRPLTKRMRKERLYRLLEQWVPSLIPLSAGLRRLLGRAGARLVPIAEYGYLGLSPEVNREWAVLDTFDMLSPQFDQPQSLATVRSWFESAGFRNIEVFRGPNGVVARG